MKNWGERLQARTIPVSAFADIPVTCDHVYKYLRSTEEVDVFFCEKCLEYKCKNKNNK